MEKRKITRKSKQNYYGNNKSLKTMLITPTEATNSTEYALEKYHKLRDQNKRNQLKKEVQEVDIL